jgi:endonuclease YncB( thermonuclease family)
MHLILSLILLLLSPVTAFADTLTGRVVRVVDGDTLVVQDINSAQYKIRLAGIDAPESGQAYGATSQVNLSQLVAGRFVVIDYRKRDPYGGIIGKVLLSNQDINLEQLKAGLAWHNKQYPDEQTEPYHALYARAENEARVARRGLWFENNPVPPWVFRKQ